MIGEPDNGLYTYINRIFQGYWSALWMPSRITHLTSSINPLKVKSSRF